MNIEAVDALTVPGTVGDPVDGDPARGGPARGDPAVLAPRCLSIDLEVGRDDARIHQFAAVRGDTGACLSFQRGDLATALRALDDFADGVSFVLGHNLIAFDAPHLAAAQPALRLLRLPMVDTLRINPLAFPRHPYHHLVKHYKEGQLARAQLNDPELDARLTLQLFADQLRSLEMAQAGDPGLVLAWHWLTTPDGVASGLNALFMRVRRAARPARGEAIAAVLARLAGQACLVQARSIVQELAGHGAADDEDEDHGQDHGKGERGTDSGWPLAYALAWLSVAGGNSVMPPWVRFQFPEAAALVRRLRDTACGDPACHWCGERHDARRELARWFGFPAFRPTPCDANGRPLQQAIVEAAMAGRHVLGILPTGTGKSLCYQVPALSRYHKTGALTVVISPLVALMADQVAGMEARGISCAVAINGLLSMPERAAALERVRLGDAGILIVSPEQLRSMAIRRALEQREIGAWVLDEAHCISKWGHDFRPDYRYVGRFIRERAAAAPGAAGQPPPVLCLTATAKPDVVADMVAHFRDKLGIVLEVIDGGSARTNLAFSVLPTTPAEKYPHIHQLLSAELPPDAQGGAIIYCATRKQTEEISRYLVDKGLAAGHFHAALPSQAKKTMQRRFIDGELKVIAATNAFGMGIDKPDVRLVIHADIPGSLENYLQEAGRAGRDLGAAQCVLLYTVEDVERQFGMSARSRLSQQEIQAILRSIKRLERKKHAQGEVIATTGEILGQEREGDFERDSATDDTRVRTAISWLEEAGLLSREENQVQVFPSSLRVASVAEVQARLEGRNLFADYRDKLVALATALIGADPDRGVSTDELMQATGLSAEKVRAALYDLEAFGIASNDTALTAFVHTAVELSSRRRLERAGALETALVAQLRAHAPDLAKGEASLLHLRHACQRLKDEGHADALPETLLRLVRSMAADGQGEDSIGSLALRQIDGETLQLTLQRSWQDLEATARLRRDAAAILLGHLLETLPEGARGNDLLAQTSLGKLLGALAGDLALCAQVRSPPRLMDRALLWLHEQDIIRLNKGLAVFRPAMILRLGGERRGFYKADYAPLQLHYEEQVVQIHVMAEYVQRGLAGMADALRLAMDYFSLEREQFMARWLPGRDKEIARQTTPASWRAIVEALGNAPQQRIVADDRERTNTLVLAGPGSGKTRVLVHRIAYLLRVRREHPQAILVLSYNRHAAVQIRRRLSELIGDDARGVLVMTCHALAMRLAGISLHGGVGSHGGGNGGGAISDADLLKQVIPQALALLRGEGLAPEEADEQRDRLLGALRWLLVDEYQDIGPDQYALIAALAQRQGSDGEAGPNLFAVGDDDQNIYAFNGASVDFIRRFEQDYAATPVFLTENYRSTRHIIDAANLLIAAAPGRMKAERPIVIDRARAKAPPGGPWQVHDCVAAGRVQILAAGASDTSQALVVLAELQRLAALDPAWDWRRVAVIAREWKQLEPLRNLCMLREVPVQMANEDAALFWRLRETQALLGWLRESGPLTDAGRIRAWLALLRDNPWSALLRQAVDEYAVESGGAELPGEHFVEWLVDWGREVRRKQSGLLLVTAHSAKGLEFDHVAVLDGDWNAGATASDRDAPRRLLYVAMTRARQTLALARFSGRPGLARSMLDDLPDSACILRRSAGAAQVAPPGMLRQCRQLAQQDIHLGFAGRHDEGHPIHRAIAALEVGDPLVLQRGDSAWELLGPGGVVVGRMSKAWAPPARMHCAFARVAALVLRKADDGDQQFRARCRCTQWEVIVPELAFDPETAPLPAAPPPSAPTP